MLGFPLLYFKGMRLMMFQLSSFYCTVIKTLNAKPSESLSEPLLSKNLTERAERAVLLRPLRGFRVEGFRFVGFRV